MNKNNQIILFAAIWFIVGIILIFFVKPYYVAFGSLLIALVIMWIIQFFIEK